MTDVVFLAPYGMDTTLRFVKAVAGLRGVRMGLLSQEPLERCPADLRRMLTAHQRVKDAMDEEQLAAGVQAIAKQMGGNVDRLLGILEQAQVPLAKVRERFGIPGMNLETARNFRDKSRMKDVLRANDVPCARHGLAKTSAEALAFARETGFPLVVKPPAGAGARNTFRVEDEAALRNYLRTMPPRADEPVLLEEFITGREFSFDSVSLGGQHAFHSVTCYHPTPLEVMQSPWLQWCVYLPRSIDGPEYAPIHDLGPRALDALGRVTGLTHMEWFRREDGSIAISEVAARPPGAQFTTLLSYAHDFDFYHAWARLVVHDEFEPPERRYACGAVFLRGQGDGKVRQVRGLAQLREEIGELIVEARIPEIGTPKAATYEGEGFVILRHPRTEVLVDGLKRVLATLRVDLGEEA
jgi:biotin carboxylase